jgi:hypothetical protein
VLNQAIGSNTEFIATSLLVLIGVYIRENTDGNFIIPHLTESLITNYLLIGMPAISIQIHAKRKHGIIVGRCNNIIFP